MKSTLVTIAIVWLLASHANVQAQRSLRSVPQLIVQAPALPSDDVPLGVVPPEPLPIRDNTMLDKGQRVTIPPIESSRYAAQMRRIRAKMTALMDRRRQIKAVQSKADEKPPVPTTTISTGIQTNAKPTTPAVQEPLPTPTPLEQGPTAVVPESKPLEPGKSAEQSPVLITPMPIDSLSFADNLFAQGRIDVALPVYEKLLAQPQKAADVVWIQYQLASCYRLDNRLKEATKYYRLVASDKTDTYWPGRARWWLDYITRLELMNKRRQEIADRLDTLREQAVELQKQ